MPASSAQTTPWQFIIGPAGGGYTLVTTAADNRRLTLRLTAPSEASFDIDGRHPEALAINELATDLHVVYTKPATRGTIVYRGRIGATTDTLDGTAHTVTVTSLDYRAVLSRRLLYNSDTLLYSGMDQADIAWQLIRQTQTKPGGDLSISPGIGSPTGTVRTLSYVAGDNIGDTIATISQLLDGFDWEITPISPSALALNIWAPLRGLYQGVVLEYGGLVESVKREVRTTDYANALRVTGDQTQPTPPTPQERASPDIGTVAQGRWDKAVPAPGILTLAALTSAADGALAYSSTLIPAYTLTLRRGAWQGPGHIWLGDTVMIVIDSGRISVTGELLRVQEMTFDIPAEGDEQVSLTVGRPPLNYNRLPSQVDQRLRDVERR